MAQDKTYEDTFTNQDTQINILIKKKLTEFEKLVEQKFNIPDQAINNIQQDVQEKLNEIISLSKQCNNYTLDFTTLDLRNIGNSLRELGTDLDDINIKLTSVQEDTYLSEEQYFNRYGKLFEACKNGEVEKVKLYYQEGININYTNSAGRTPLSIAAMAHRPAVVELLIRLEADVNARTETGWTIMDGLAEITPQSFKTKDIIGRLKKAGAKVDTINMLCKLDINLAASFSQKSANSFVNEINEKIGGYTPLHEAVRKQNIENIKWLLEQGASIEALDQDGFSTIHLACYTGNVKIVDLLLNKLGNDKANKYIYMAPKKNDKYLPLQIAIDKGHSDLEEFLIKKGAYTHPIKLKDKKPLKDDEKYSDTLLNKFNQIQNMQSDYDHYDARDFNGFGFIELILGNVDEAIGYFNKAIEIDQKFAQAYINRGKAYVAKNQDKEALKDYRQALKLDPDLLEIKDSIADIISRLNGSCTTALMLAAKNNDLDTVSMLIENGVRIDEKNMEGETALMLAAKNGHNKVLDIFITTGQVNLEEKDYYGRTALILASYYGHIEVVQQLIRQNVDIEAKDHNGMTALIVAVERNNYKVVDCLVENRANIEACDNKGKTSFTWSIAKGHVRIFQLIIKKQDNIDSKNKLKEIALFISAQNGDIEFMKFLVNDINDINIKSANGKTVLMIATQHNRLAIIQLLIDNNANIEDKDQDGNTALMVAVKQKKIEAIKLLLSNGANLKVTDNDGKYIYQYAKEQDNQQIIDLLENFTKMPESFIRGPISGIRSKELSY